MLEGISNREKIKLRAIVESDENILLQWRNDNMTRQFSRNNKLVSETEHKEWFSKVILDQSVDVQMALLDDEVVGTIRLDAKNSEAELSWTVSPEHRGHGIGGGMISAYLLSCKIRPLFASIRSDNVASKRIAESCGFKVMNEKNDFHLWRLDSF